MTGERCNPPDCVRLVGHDGECRPTYHRRAICGRRLRIVGEPCARTAGHRWACKSRAALTRMAARP